ncbi:hypothetical protein ACX1DX_14445 [Tessaracoccus sp. Y36]
MSMSNLHPVPPSSAPDRRGEPWTDDDYRTMVTLCRQGAVIDELCQALGRTSQAVLGRVKRLLPMAERGAPGERVLAQLHKHLVSDDHYDWESHLAALPPPRPVINHVHPPDQLTGIPGLHDNELLLVAAALFQAGKHTPTGRLMDECASAIRRRNLVDRFIQEMVDQAHDVVNRSGYGFYPGYR